MKKDVICGKILMFDDGTCPHSLTDKATAFEAVDGGSIPSGDTKLSENIWKTQQRENKKKLEVFRPTLL